MQLRAASALLTVLLCGCDRAEPPPPLPDPPVDQRVPSPYTAEFWNVWRDGKAEVAVYDLKVRRGGQWHNGSATAVCLLEKFSGNLGATSSTGGEAMRFNLLKDVDGERSMVSVWVALDIVNGRPHGGAIKVSRSSQSPFGHSWNQLMIGGERAVNARYSLDGGDTRTSLRFPVHATPEEALILAARRIAFPILRLGETRTVHVLAPLSEQRLELRDVAVTLGSERTTTNVPAGAFRTREFRAGARRSWDVEVEAPYRVIRWRSDDETAELRTLERGAAR